jgi:magnesium chelatase accessory protein
MKERPDWQVEGADWPHRACSRFVRAAGFDWHVQIIGQGPGLLLLHGTGASGHSWRDLVPVLAEHFTLIIPDLPGHGFSHWRSRGQLSLPEMASQVAALLAELGLPVTVVAGHSAGVAILLHMALVGDIAPVAVVSINGALRPFRGVEGLLYPALAKVMFLNPLTPSLLAWKATDRVAVGRVIAGTGSKLTPEGIDYYARLLATRRHVGATLGMMANWDLRPLQRDLAYLKARLTLIAAERDSAVPPAVAEETQRLLPAAELLLLPRLGHLAHEEDPVALAGLIVKACIL